MMHIDELRVKIKCDQCNKHFILNIADPFYLEMSRERIIIEMRREHWHLDEFGNWFCDDCNYVSV